MLTRQRTVVTNSSGNYQFDNLAAGTYIVIPELGEKNFMPTFRQVAIIDDNVTDEDFESLVGTAPTMYGSISGSTQRETGTQIVGETIQLTGLPNNQGRFAVSTSDGIFTITNLPDGTFTVRPISTRYIYSPESAVITVSNASNHTQAFVAVSEIPTGPGEPPEDLPFIISGRITSTATTTTAANGGPYTPITRDVYATLTGAMYQRVTLSDSNGDYRFAGVPDGTYTVTLSKVGHTMSNNPQTLVVNNGNVSAVNSVMIISYNIQGTIRYEDTTIVGMNWTVNASGPRTEGATVTVMTNVSGLFTLTPCPPGIYTLTPVRAGYRFEPPSRTVTMVTAHQTLQDFVAIPD